MAKKIQDQSKFQDQDYIMNNKRAAQRQGIAQKSIDEAIPTLEKGQSEKYIMGNNNSMIVLGRDRPNNLFSGYGGKGATQAGRIDLIAGLAASYRHPDGTYSPPNSDTVVNPNFSMDAARVYISQKADIDRYMGLAPVPNQAAAGRSTIGLKADTIRIHSREDIKIVTGRARFEKAGPDGERLSTGGVNEVVGTISLIAGNYTEDEKKINLSIFKRNGFLRRTVKKLQPIPKGENLADCLEEIIVAIEELSALVGDNVSMIQKMDIAISNHQHLVAPANFPPYPPVALAPSTYTPTTAFIQTKIAGSTLSRQLFNKGLQTLKMNYLNENFGPVYINSKYVFTT